jgi:hypothetical protein
MMMMITPMMVTIFHAGFVKQISTSPPVRHDWIECQQCGKCTTCYVVYSAHYIKTSVASQQQRPGLVENCAIKRLSSEAGLMFLSGL